MAVVAAGVKFEVRLELGSDVSGFEVLISLRVWPTGG